MKIELDKLDKYFFADPASGKRRLRRKQARQAIVGIATDWLTRVFVFYAWAGRLTASKFRDKIIDVYGRFQPRLFGIEANAMQELFGDLVIDKARKQFGSIRMVPVYQPTKIDKDFRIRTSLEPLMFDGRLFILGERSTDSEISGKNKHLKELIMELKGFPTADTKDLVDSLASANSLVPKRTYKEQRSDESEELAAYLRAQGVPPHIIERRIEEVRREAETIH